MFATLTVFAAEAHGIGAPWMQLSVPIGILVFIGLTYMLVRSNLGTRRGYLVTGASLFGFLVIYAAFWTWGAPGTPSNTGPQNLPGQELDAYQPVFRPFAPDSLVAEDPEYAIAQEYPDAFSPDKPATLTVGEQVAIDEIKTFFSTQDPEFMKTPPLHSTDTALNDEVLYALAENDRPIIAVPYVPTYQPATGAEVAEGEELPLTPRGEALKGADGENLPEDADPADAANVADPGTEIGTPVEDAEPQVFFAFFDAGAPYFPSYLMLGLSILLFAIHLGLLFLDESRERREARDPDEVVVGEKVRVDA